MGFRLIAVRPLSDCNPAFRRVLQPDCLYQFYHDYTFKFADKDNKGDVVSIDYAASVPEDLYNVKGTPVSISAVVGKNGSGKSTILELLFGAVHNLAAEKQILRFVEDGRGEFDPIDRIAGLSVELYYEIEGTIYCMRVMPNPKADIHFHRYVRQGNSSSFLRIRNDEKYDIDLHRDFFYSVATNYSFYGLNSELGGTWIRALFHKNDGYQTPIVINPYRDGGNIDINTELYLAKQRLLSNILKPVVDGNDSHRKLTEYQEVTAFTFSLSEKKIQYAFSRGTDDDVSFDKFFETDKREVLLGHFYEVFEAPPKTYTTVKYFAEVENYIIKKLIKIARTYADYQKFFTDHLILHEGVPGSTVTKAYKYSMHFISIDSFRTYLKQLFENRSHITIKLRQALNYLKNDVLQDGQDANWTPAMIKGDEGQEFRISADDLSRRLARITRKQEKIIEAVPPSLFDIEIHLSQVSDDTGESKAELRVSLFSQLSSGEQQLIQSVQGIVYHINNLISVYKDDSDLTDKIRYQYINIMLDEIELYFHPDYQRKFIDYLQGSLSVLNLGNIKGFNILFSTHSPFILSDIPSTSVLKLKKGEPLHDPDERTFGANIHDLLAKDFFLDAGFMGKVAERKISEVIDYLNLKLLEIEIAAMQPGGRLFKVRRVEYDELKDRVKIMDSTYCKIIIEMIGEPILRSRLQGMYREICDKEIRLAELEEQKQKIEEEIKKLK